MSKEYYVYIVTNPARSVLYTGVTNNLERRLMEHYSNRGKSDSFAGKYYCYLLLFYEIFPNSYDAIEAEKKIKNKNRAQKKALIRLQNPSFSAMNKMVCMGWSGRNKV